MRVPRPPRPALQVHRNSTTHTRAPACPQATARPAWVNGWPVSGCWLADEGTEAMSAGRSGLPMPRRWTFAFDRMKGRRRCPLVGRDCSCFVSGWWLADEGPEAMSAGRSGLPMPRRRTFASALTAFAHSEETALRHPWLRWFPRPARGAWATPTCMPFCSAQGRPDSPGSVSSSPSGTQRAAGSRRVPPRRLSTLRHAASRRLAPRAIRVAPPRRQSAQNGPPHPAGRTPSAARKAAGRAEARRAQRGQGWPAER